VGAREDRWLIQNMASYFQTEQGGSHGTGAINREKDHRDITLET
jgi:hypothetical protein